MKTTKTLAACEKDIQAKLTAAKSDFKGSRAKYDKAKAALTQSVADYNKAVVKDAYAKLAATAAPFVAFSTEFYAECMRVKETKDRKTKLVTAVDVVPSTRRMKLDDFLTAGGFDPTIKADILKLRDLLYIRENGIMKLTHKDLQEKSPYFCAVVTAKSEGKTPDSNRQICMLLQGILDKMGISAEVTNPDMRFLQQNSFVHDKRGKCREKMVPVSESFSLILDVMNHFTEGTPYSLLEEKRKNEAAVAAAA